MPLEAGQILNNRYRIVKLLGQGGFGAVYRAWDLNLEKPCALKENLNTSEDAQRQFKREARILSDLTHPNLPHVIDHFILPGQGQYLVMDFVEGEDLSEMLQSAGGPLPEAEVLPWIVQVCDALEYMHAQLPPVIHRDIKPANIKIAAANSAAVDAASGGAQPAGKAMLVDFGIAKLFDAELKTTMGARAVTPCYSPLEQYGRGTTDARSDVYALGATLYTVLTGHEPPESVARATGAPLILPRTLNPAISPAVEAAIVKAMQMKPEDRYANVGELKAILQRSAAFLSKQAARRRPSSPVMVAPVNAGKARQVSPAVAAPPNIAAPPEASATEQSGVTLPPARRKVSTRVIVALIVVAVLVNLCLCLWFLGVVSSS